MAKTEKENQELKDKVADLRKELKELSDEELDQVAGGGTILNCPNATCRYNYLRNRCDCELSTLEIIKGRY